MSIELSTTSPPTVLDHALNVTENVAVDVFKPLQGLGEQALVLSLTVVSLDFPAARECAKCHHYLCRSVVLPRDRTQPHM